MIKNRLNALCFFLVFTLALLWGVSLSKVRSETTSRPQVLLERAGACRDSMYRSSSKMKYRNNWSKCIKLYEVVYSRYPKSDQAGWALYRAARMFTKLYRYSGRERDLDEAIKLFGRLVKKHKTHRLADDAQYRIGEIYYDHKKDPTQAYVEFLKVDIRFPSGDMRLKARRMLDKLAVVIAKKDRGKSRKRNSATTAKLTPVKNIRHWSTPSYTRVVIDLGRPVKYVSHVLKRDRTHKKPRRLYVDLKKAFVSSEIESSIPIRDGLLQRARAGQFDPETVRVVLDINSISTHKIFHLYDPFRIVVDVRGIEKKAGRKKKISDKKGRPVRKGIRKVPQPDQRISLARQLGLTVKRIVIDPGHGGKDPGTYLRGGVREKQIVLQVAKKLAEKIRKKLGREVILTRRRDVFLSLERRTAFANMKKADLFVSLHINALKQRGVHGLETYFLNMATDERAVMVAARENATSEKNISDLQKILNDLMLNTKINESSRLAHEVQRGMVFRLRKRYDKVGNLGVKQAPFYVLIGAEMPSILVEMGFITNKRERNRLQSKAYQEVLADGIVAGIDAYIKSIDLAYKGG